MARRKRQAGSLVVIAGCMFSGKSEEMVRQLRRAEIAHRRALVVRPTVDTRAQTQAIAMFLGSVTCVAFYGTATFMPFKPWAWTFGLLVIALGVPGLTVFVCLPLLLAWLKPEVKAAFCRL